MINENEQKFTLHVICGGDDDEDDDNNNNNMVNLFRGWGDFSSCSQYFYNYYPIAIKVTLARSLLYSNNIF